MTDLEKYQTPATQLVDWGQAARAAHDLAQGLVGTAFVPDHFKGKQLDATAAILAGAEVGLSPLQALNSTFVIGGKPAYYARTMVALVQAQGHDVWTVEETPSKVTVAGLRAGQPDERATTVTVTLEQARKAGWTRNKKYDTEPSAMLWARAASTVCRRIAADALLGIPYSAEELVDEQEASTAPSTRKVRGRKPAPVPSPPELPAGPDDPTTEPPGGAAGTEPSAHSAPAPQEPQPDTDEGTDQ